MPLLEVTYLANRTFVMALWIITSCELHVPTFEECLNFAVLRANQRSALGHRAGWLTAWLADCMVGRIQKD